MTTDLSTNYLGIRFSSPFIIGASPLVDSIDKVLRLEDQGAAGIVLHSLFEEQISRDAQSTVSQIEAAADSYAEALSYFPDVDDYKFGAEDYLAHLARIKERSGFPVIASLNGRTPGGWVEYAREMEQAGADALELNLYDVPTDPDISGADLEDRYAAVVRGVCTGVKIPVSVKLSPFFTSLPNFARRLEKCGAKGAVLFNRFYQPDLNIEDLAVEPRLYLSTSSELLLRLRWMAILHDRCGLSLALSGGVHHVQDAVKGIMSGADVLQIVSLLLRQGVEALGPLVEAFKSWLEEHEYNSVGELRGCLSSRHSPDPSEFERANYLRILQLWKD